ncbi:MAG: hypothetical protein WD648_01700 [Planctomycetaceae bacterium]
MSIKRTLLGGCALLGSLLVWQPVPAAEPLEVKTLLHQKDSTVIYPYDSSNPYAVGLDDGTGVPVQQVQHGGHGHGGHGHGGHGHGGHGHHGGFSAGFGYGGYGGYYGRGYFPGYYGYSQPYYGYGSYYPRYYGYNYSYYSPSSVSIGVGGPGYSAYYGGYPYYGSYGYCH